MSKNNMIQQYSNLCAVYGDLMLKKEQLDLDIVTIKSQLKQLQDAMNKQTKESQNEQETTDKA